MPATPQHVCKFDPSHGVFPTPVKLGNHYRAMHPGYAPRLPPSKKLTYRCRLCGMVVKTRHDHMPRHHPELAKPWTQYFDKVDSATGDRPDVLVELRSMEVTRRAIDDQRERVAPRHVGPWTVDDIVLPVVEELAAPRGMVPVAHLAAIFAWREATAAMLSTVTSR